MACKTQRSDQTVIRLPSREYRDATEKPGIVCCPYDAEIWGHWWFEDPQFLYRVLKKLWADPKIDLTNGGRCLDEHLPPQIVASPEGSWGEGGFHSIWLKEENAWTWRQFYPFERERTRLASEYSDTKNLQLMEILESVFIRLCVESHETRHLLFQQTRRRLPKFIR